jgi:putative ABC transport system ATP-binding protein
MLTLKGLRKTYGGPENRAVLSGIDLTVEPGQYIAIMGESGVGKSTLLNLIAGLDLPDSGSIALDGIELTRLDDNVRTRMRREHMGFVFQAFHLLPHLNLLQNVALPLRIRGDSADSSRERAMALLEAVDLHTRAERYPRTLSGGEMQRAAIARALVHRPQLLLADEPTGNLDSKTARRVLELLREQVKSHAGAGILVTHSQAAAATADCTWVLTSDGLSLCAG